MDLLFILGGVALGLVGGIWAMHGYWGRTFDGKSKNPAKDFPGEYHAQKKRAA